MDEETGAYLRWTAADVDGTPKTRAIAAIALELADLVAEVRALREVVQPSWVCVIRCDDHIVSEAEWDHFQNDVMEHWKDPKRPEQLLLMLVPHGITVEFRQVSGVDMAALRPGDAPIRGPEVTNDVHTTMIAPDLSHVRLTAQEGSF